MLAKQEFRIEPVISIFSWFVAGFEGVAVRPQAFVVLVVMFWLTEVVLFVPTVWKVPVGTLPPAV